MIKIEDYYDYLINLCRKKYKEEWYDCEDYVGDFILKTLEKNTFPEDLHLKPKIEIQRFIGNCFINFKIDKFRWENREMRRNLLNPKSTEEIQEGIKGKSKETKLLLNSDDVDEFIKFNLSDIASDLKDRLSGLDKDIFKMHYLSNLTLIDIREIKKSEGKKITKRDIQLSKNRIRDKAKTLYACRDYQI